MTDTYSLKMRMDVMKMKVFSEVPREIPKNHVYARYNKAEKETNRRWLRQL